MRSLIFGVVSAGALAALVGCASTPSPTVETGPEAEVTADGLHRIDDPRMALAYAKPDLDLSGYTRFMLDPVTVSYKKDPGQRRTSMGAGEQNFALTPSQMENLRTWFQEEVVAALTRDDGYELVDAPAPDVLRITADLMDLTVTIPTQETGGRERMATRSFFEVTLVLELRDSESGEIFARVAERRDPGSFNQTATYVTTSTVQRDTRQMFRYWAEILREGLDDVRAVVSP
jgi:hypothetical protein